MKESTLSLRIVCSGGVFDERPTLCKKHFTISTDCIICPCCEFYQWNTSNWEIVNQHKKGASDE